jgi:hypothetical protein
VGISCDSAASVCRWKASIINSQVLKIYSVFKRGSLMGEEGLMEENWNDRRNWRKKIIVYNC